MRLLELHKPSRSGLVSACAARLTKGKYCTTRRNGINIGLALLCCRCLSRMNCRFRISACQY
jgi:hypothetical protein